MMDGVIDSFSRFLFSPAQPFTHGRLPSVHFSLQCILHMIVSYVCI